MSDAERKLREAHEAIDASSGHEPSLSVAQRALDAAVRAAFEEGKQYAWDCDDAEGDGRKIPPLPSWLPKW